MKYFLCLTTLLLGIALGASAVFVYQPIRARLTMVRNTEQLNTKAAQPLAASIIKISLQRMEGVRNYPVYEVTLEKDGTASYIGESNVKLKGTYKGNFNKLDFDYLAKLLESNNYYGLADKYHSCFPSGSQVITRVSYSNRTGKTVDRDVAINTTELWQIETAIDGVASKIDWQPDK